MSSKEKDSYSQVAVKPLNNPHYICRTSNGLGGITSLARFVRDRDETQTEYLMRQTRVTVGRSSARSGADVDMGESSFISRYHLEIYIDQSRFFILVTGKNGVFVDDEFVKKGSPPMELPDVCELRFPSTAIRLKFESLVNSSSEEQPLEQLDCCEVTDEADAESAQLESVVVHSSASVVATDEDTNSDVNAYVEETMSDGEQCLNSVDVVPISLETEEVWAPSPQKVEQPAFPVASVRHTPVVQSNTLASSRGPRDESKPPYSYAQLIVQAIMSTVDKQLTLSGIYAYITQNYPYYRASDKGWQNSIRHNLSLNRYFIKVARSQEESGKGSFWRVDPSSEAMLVDQAYRRRRQRGSVGTPQFMKAAIHPDFRTNSEVCTPEDSLSWDDQTEGVVDGHQQTVYIANHSSDTPSRVTVQHVGDFNWSSTYGHARLIQVDPTSSSSTSLVEETADCDEDTSNVQSTYEVETTRPDVATSTVFRSQLAANTGAMPQITLLHTGLSNNTSVSSTSLTSPAAVVRYITTYSQGNAMKQAVLFPVLKVGGNENVTTTLGERTLVKTSPTMSVLSNHGTSFITNGRSVSQQQTFIGATNLLQQNALPAGGITDIRFPVVNTVLAGRKRSAEAVVTDEGIPLMKSECVGSAAV